jgi:hypothetical protein
MTVEIRGTAFVTFFEAIRELRGPATEAAVRAALAVELRERFERGAITRIGWYALSDYAALHAASERVIGGGPTFARQLGRTSTEIDTRGLIRYVLAIASPDLLMRHAQLVFSSYVRGCAVRPEKLGPGHYRLHWEGMTGVSALVNAELEGGTAYLVERTGGRDVLLEPAPTHEAGSHAFDVRWR